MKKKLIVGMILIFFIFSIVLNFESVEAYSGELDPESYITLPSMIWIKNGIGTGTIYLSSSASDYSVSYQKVDINQSIFNNLNNKNEEVNDYIDEAKQTLKEKEANVRTLQTEYQTLEDSETATEEAKEEAYNKYIAAYEDYQQFVNTTNTNIDKLKNEFYGLVPNYTSSWQSTTNSSDNVQLDFSNYSGTAYFILWVKITNGTNTYYDMNMYSSTIETEETVTINKSSASIKVDETLQLTANSSKNSNITWTSSNNSVATVSSSGLVKGIKEGSTVITAKGDEKTANCTVTVTSKTTNDGQEKPDDEENTSSDWTDFSNAKFELKKEGISKAVIQISNVTPKDDNYYCLFITSNSSKPNVTSDDDTKIHLSYDSNNKMFKTIESSKVAKYIELNQELYVTIVECVRYTGDENVVLYGKRLDRFAEAKYSDAFHATYMDDQVDQIITTFTHSEEHNRKIQIKVGKITDNSILQKIKSQDLSGFANLLSFAKSNNGIYNQTVDADKNDRHAIEYNAGEGTKTNNSVINLNGLKDGEYYFIYIKTDDENGKYVPNEAVTLGQSYVNSNGWGIHFYGSSDFKWVDFGNVSTNKEPSKDQSTAQGVLPQTGLNILVWIVLGIAVVGGGTFFYIQYRRNNF